MSGILAGRELGELPLSVATSEAISSLLKEGTDGRRNLWINLHTLFRNLHGAVAADQRGYVMLPQWQQALWEEVLQIKTLLAPVIAGELIFYLPTYEHVLKHYPRAQIRATKAAKQIEYSQMAGEVLAGFVKRAQEMLDGHQITVRKFDVELKGFPPSAFIITSFALDLLSCRSDTILLETHTAARKPPSQWNTKFVTAGQQDMPFNRLTLQVFGDKTTFSPMPIKIKESLINLAKERKWTPLTTQERIAFSIREMRDYVARDFFLALLQQ